MNSPGSAGVMVTKITSADAAREAASFVSERTVFDSAAPVDEAEWQRLEAAATGVVGPERWIGLLARSGGTARGYLGIHPDGDADLVADDSETVRSLLGGADDCGAEIRRIWVRGATGTTTEALSGLGYVVDRRLLVLARSLDLPISYPDLPGGVEVRGFVEEDETTIVDLLRAAYAGTPEGDWTVEEFRARRAMPWFRSEDLLVAEGRPRDIAGIHWTKRRTETVGEVYNLAVAPDCQGLGLGRSLLRAGLRHLVDVGRGEVVLWVDEANTDAVTLYTSEGFSHASADVAYARV